jgi:phosphoribosyl 1,2-cyclic phosphate phosphodiesterase
MKISYLGTAAGEAWPGVFCDCDLCRKARTLGGKNIRTRSQALINEDLLLDMPPDHYLHILYGGLEPGRVRTLLFTHSHSDHCYPNDLELLQERTL